jgi:hypothetical protein
VALDDTRLKKTGKRIPLAFYQRDPLSPPFHVNLQWGLRFLQVSVLLPLPRKYNMNARAVPVRFVLAPIVKKPKRNASSEQRATVPLSATAAQLKPTSSPLARPLAPELGSGGCCRQTLAGGRGCPLL